jgi:hypothetical protein
VFRDVFTVEKVPASRRVYRSIVWLSSLQALSFFSLLVRGLRRVVSHASLPSNGLVQKQKGRDGS